MRAVQKFEISLKAFIIREGHVLMLREADTGFWELPGGRIDCGEEVLSFEAILLREIAEELGPEFRIKPTHHLVPFMRLRPTDNQHILQLARICRAESSNLSLSPEHQAHAWVTRSQCQALQLPPQSTYSKGLETLWEHAVGA